MITVTWKSTGAVCARFRTIESLANWIKTAGHEKGVTRKVGTHPSVDLRDVNIPPIDEEDAWDYIRACEALGLIAKCH